MLPLTHDRPISVSLTLSGGTILDRQIRQKRNRFRLIKLWSRANVYIYEHLKVASDDPRLYVSAGVNDWGNDTEKPCVRLKEKKGVIL
jgi:hypothetical protein